MGRIARKGFDYYRAETNRFQDIKIRRLKKKFKCAGYAIYQYVLNEIYRVEGCYVRFSVDELFDCSEYWALEDSEVRAIIDYCTEVGLFDAKIWSTYGILTARSIQVRYADMCRVLKRKPVIPANVNLLSGEEDCNRIPESITAVPAVAENVTAISTGLPVVSACAATASSMETKATDMAGAEEAGGHFAAKTILPEETGIIPEESGNTSNNTIINKNKANNISSSAPSTVVPDKPAVEEEDEVLLNDFLYLGLSEDDFRWAVFLKGYYPDIPIATAVRMIKSDRTYKITGTNYLKPLIKNYIGKYNAEYSRKKGEDDRSDELDRMGIPAGEKEIILRFAADSPLVYAAAMAEIKKSKGKIKSPVCFLKSRLVPAKTA